MKRSIVTLFVITMIAVIVIISSAVYLSKVENTDGESIRRYMIVWRNGYLQGVYSELTSKPTSPEDFAKMFKQDSIKFRQFLEK